MNDIRYNIRIILKARHALPTFKSGLTLQELEDSVVARYKKGSPIVLDGRIMALEDIDKITIKRVNATPTRRNLFARIMDFIFPSDKPANFDFSGVDVTEEFISAPPGLVSNRGVPDMLPGSPNSSIRVFISHNSNDVELVRVLIDLLQKALRLASDDIRCTSIDGFGMPGGSSIDETLRAEVHNADVLVGLVTPNSIASTYVIFELGARWGAGKPMIPLLASGVTADDLEEPLGGINVLDSSQEGQVLKLVEDVAAYLDIEQDKPSSYMRSVNELARLSKVSDSIVGKVSARFALQQLSADAKKLLTEAAKDKSGTISMSRTMGGVAIQTNDKDFGKSGNRRSEARWEQAMQDLLNRGLIRDLSGNGQGFEVTDQGFQTANSIEPPE